MAFTRAQWSPRKSPNYVRYFSDGLLAENIKKGQFKTGKLGGCDATMTELWHAALAA